MGLGAGFRAYHEQLRRKSWHGWIDGSDLDVVTELAKRSCQSSRAMLLQFGIAFRTLFDESDTFMQDLPNYAAEAEACQREADLPSLRRGH